MARLIITSRLIVTLFAAASFAACSSESPVAPSPLSAVGGTLARGHLRPFRRGRPRLHRLERWCCNRFRVSSARSAELIDRAYVTDSSGSPALKGRVTFEICSDKGGPPNDITRPNEAPKESWGEDGAGHLGASGFSVGRVRFSAQPQALVTHASTSASSVFRGSSASAFATSRREAGIPAGVTPPENFIWVEAS